MKNQPMAIISASQNPSKTDLQLTGTISIITFLLSEGVLDKAQDHLCKQTKSYASTAS